MLFIEGDTRIFAAAIVGGLIASKHRWARHFSRFLSRDKGTRKRRYRSYLSFAYRLCSARAPINNAPAIRSPFQNIVALSATGCLVTRHGARCTILSHFCPLIFARMPSQLSREKSSITDFTLLRTFSNEIFHELFQFFRKKDLCNPNSISFRENFDRFVREKSGCFKTTNGGKRFWSTRRQVLEQREKGGDRYRRSLNEI